MGVEIQSTQTKLVRRFPASGELPHGRGNASRLSQEAAGCGKVAVRGLQAQPTLFWIILNTRIDESGAVRERDITDDFPAKYYQD